MYKKMGFMAAMALTCLPAILLAEDAAVNTEAKALEATEKLLKEDAKGKTVEEKKREAQIVLGEIEASNTALRGQANEITQQMSKLSIESGSDNDAVVAQMQKFVEQFAEINKRLKRNEEAILAIRSWIDGQQMALASYQSGGQSSGGFEKKSRLKGFVQLDYTETDKSGGTNAAFQVRRAEMGYEVHVNENTWGSITADFATGTGRDKADLRDAWMRYIEPKSGLRFQAGQFKLPLGYEVSYGSEDREFPEYTIYNDTMFNNVRSRGVSVQHKFEGGGTLEVGLVNALTTGDKEQANLAPGVGDALAGYARLGIKKDDFSIGLSTLIGERPAFSDDNGVTVSPKIDRRFFYLDGEYRGLKDLILRGEIMLGHDRIPNASADPGLTGQDMLGWHVFVGYNFNERNQLAFRYQQFDRNDNTSGDAVTGWGFAFNHFINQNLRLTAAYEIFDDGTLAKDYHVGILRAQVRF